jgi:hypothetical protein
MKAVKEEITNAPKLDEFLQIAQSQPVVINPKDKENLHLLYKKMKGVAVCGDDEYRNIWFPLDRGKIEDYGNYEDFLEEEVVEDHAGFEEMWLSDYPETLKWYDFAVNEYNGEYFFYINSELTFHIAKELPEYYEKIDNKPLISYLINEVNHCVDWLQADEAGYNCYVNENLSYSRRTGKILRQKLWEISSFDKKLITKGIHKNDIEILKDIVNQSAEDNKKNYLQEMTAGQFFDYCRMGYEANNYFKGKEMSGLEMYNAFADGRHEGLTGIDPDSAKAFANWYSKDLRGGHPWEICRGGNSTHISLYVQKKINEGWNLRLTGSSSTRVNETVKFAIALYKNHVPFELSDAEEIYNMVCGTDYIGIVPEEVFPRYCHSLFSEEDERIIDFMNLGWEETDKIIAAAEWYPIEIKANNNEKK